MQIFHPQRSLHRDIFWLSLVHTRNQHSRFILKHELCADYKTSSGGEWFSSPLFAYKLSFLPEKAQKSGLFYITFRILIGILTGKAFTENSSSRKSMPGSDRHSTPRQMYLISDHPSIFVAGISLRLRTMQVTLCTIRSRPPGTA